ncbi:MAG: hypothetical protein Q4Q03_02030, partial [Bowdeniella nasicola]|nr:hypothetical protein [Bowdeniella nasicola]
MAKSGTRIGIVIFTAIFVVLGTLAVGGYFYSNYLADTKYSPANEVETYLQAIIDGDATTVMDRYRPGGAKSDLALASDDLAQSATDRPSDYTIGDVNVSGKTARVSAYLTMAGKEYPVDFKLIASGKTNLFFNRWKIMEAPEQYLYVGNTPSDVTINGIDVDLPIDTNQLEANGYVA